jgi:hypothetical protein
MPITSNERDLIRALQAALRWGYMDTRDHALKGLPSGDWDASYKADLHDIRQGIKIVELLGEKI